MADGAGIIRVVETPPEVLPDRRSLVLTADFGTETVVWVKGTKVAHHLTGLGAILFDACDGSTRTADFIDEVAEVIGCTREEATEAVSDTWRALVGNGLMA